MKALATIPAPTKTKKPFIQNGKKDPFIKNNALKKSETNRVIKEESKAEIFAQKATLNQQVMQAFLQNPITRKNAQKPTFNKPPGSVEWNSQNLHKTIVDAFKIHFNEDFSAVQIHTDDLSTKIAKQHNAAALTSGNHIFMNMDVYHPGTQEGLSLLAHELYHTIQPANPQKNIEIQLKPLTELNDRTPDQNLALNRAVKIAQGEKGKVNSGTLNEDKTRVGWQFLVEYFKTTLGEDTIVKDQSEYKPGKFLEEIIKYVKKGKAQKVKVVDGKHVVVTENNVDLLPSWCGIFAFWALHKGGIHPPKWELGKPNFTSKDQFKKGEYLPRPGDIVIKSGYNHHALVVRTEPNTITDTKELQNVKVITINGNTAGSNHQGGQIQEKTDSYAYWDFYVNPFFKGVELTPEKDFKVDDRLKESIGEKSTGTTVQPASNNANLSVNKYDSNLEPVTVLEPAKEKKEEEKKTNVEAAEESKMSPKEIMAKDAEFKDLNSTLNSNAKKQQAHEPAENKASEALKSSVSPINERLSKAKAVKVEKMATLPKPKTIKAEDLKNAILKEVDRLLKEKEQEANDTGEKPKIKEQEIKEVKQANNKDIQSKKTASVGEVEQTHKQAPDENAIEKRESIDVITEDAGPSKKIGETEKAVAKPIADERITLENESGKIDEKMAENDVDETQLEESNEEKFTGSLEEKRGSQSEAAKVKDDYRKIEDEKLAKDKKAAQYTVSSNVEKIHEVRKGEFGNVDTVKGSTKSADELKRKEISDKIEKLYTDAEKSVTDKLAALETSVSEEFDSIMQTANTHFKDNVNNALDDEFTWEWAAKNLDRADYNRRVKKVFVKESDKYKQELSDALNPLTTKIANTLNSIVDEIQAAKNTVIVFVNGLGPALAEIGVQSAKGVLEKFSSLEESVNEKQNALTNNLAKKYADGVIGLEEEFKKIMDSRKSWLEKALDAIIDAIKEIVNLFIDLKKALERAAEYGKRIIKAPLKFFGNLVKGASAGFNNFVKNIGKHLLQGALEWVTGEMGEAGIQLPEKFDFKGILSIILQILGISINNIKEIAKKVIGAKYVALLEKGADLGVKAGDKILQIFTIIKKEGIAGLWEFIKEQFNDLKEKMMEEAKSFVITTIVEVAVIKVVSMLIPGAGFISAVKSLIDFLRTLFAKARQIVNIITGIIDTFGEILAGNVAKVSSMVENVLAKFLGLAITFLAAILGLGKIGKKINDIIQKKIKDPINKAITKMMEKLKTLMTKLGIFKFLDKIEDKIKKGKDWVDDKKEKIKDKAKEALNKLKGFLKNLTNKYTDESGETHTLKFKDTELYRESVSKTLGNYLNEVRTEINEITNADEKKKHAASVNKAFGFHRKIVDLIGETVKQTSGKYTGADKGFSPAEGEKLRGYLQEIAAILRTLPLKSKKKVIPKTKINYTDGVADGIHATASLISLDSDEAGSQPAGNNSPLSQGIIDIVLTKKDNHNLVRGHLINHELYGTGVGTKNLAPIPKRANSKMLNNFEKDAKNLVHSNSVISLDVTMNYGEPNDKKLSGQSLLKKKLPAGSKIPTSVSYDLKQLEFDGASNAKADTLNNPKKWKAAGTARADSITINHDDFF
jgi:hypothetical protein